MSRTHYNTGSRRHPAGGVRLRDTHTGQPELWTPPVVGLPFAEARDGEQVQVPDIAPQVIQTEHFDRVAKAPQVNNNPEAPAAANVYITPEGLFVKDGAIFIEDLSGASVLEAAGFGGSWLDFLATGFYNGTFGSGIGTSQPPPSRVQVLAESHLPYWIKDAGGGAAADQAVVYHGSSTDADSLMEAKLWAAQMPVGGFISIQQLIPITQVVGRRATTTLGGVHLELATGIIQDNPDYAVVVAVTEYGYGLVDTILVPLELEVEDSGGIGGAINMDINALNPLTTHLLVKIKLRRELLLTGGLEAEVALRNIQVNVSKPLVLIEGGLGAGRVVSASLGGGVQALDLDPLWSQADTSLKQVRARGSMHVPSGKLARYVPLLTTYQPLNFLSSAIDIAKTDLELTSLPTAAEGLVAVEVIALFRNSSVINGTFQVFNYGASSWALIAYGLAMGQYSTLAGIVACGGTNGRSIQYAMSRGGSGSGIYGLRVNGYWTTL